MKVLHLIDSGGLYGAEKMLLALIAEQIKSGVEPVLLSCGEVAEEAKPLELEAEKQSFEVIVWRMKPGLNISGVYDILTWAKANKIEVLHTHGFKFNVLVGLLPKFLRSQFKWVVTVHGFIPARLFSKSFIYQFLDKKISRLADRLCLVSPAMLDIPDFKRHKKTSVILNGISSSAVTKAEIKAKSATFKLLTIGRLSPEKGMEYLLQALAILSTQGIKNISLTIMGDGELRQTLIEQIAQLGLTEQVTLSGFVDGPVEHFFQYDALVMPSLTEGIPITLLEAMREGLPIIASRVGGIPFILGDDYEFLVAPGEAEDLAKKLSSFADKPLPDIEKLVAKNRDSFLRHYTAEKMSKDYLDVYKSLI